MESLIAIGLLIGLLLSLRVNVVALTIFTVAGAVCVLGISLVLEISLIFSMVNAVVFIASLEAGYVLGLIALAACRR